MEDIYKSVEDYEAGAIDSRLYRNLYNTAYMRHRMPQNLNPRQLGLIKTWAKQGLLRVEIYGKNWRVIHFLSSGHRTMEPPFKNNGPYRVLGLSGKYEYTELVHENRKAADRKREVQASKHKGGVNCKSYKTQPCDSADLGPRWSKKS